MTFPCGDAERMTRQMAHRSSRHRIRPIAALALEAGTTIGPRCANVHLGPEAERLHREAGYTTAPDPMETVLAPGRSTSGRSPYTGCWTQINGPPGRDASSPQSVQRPAHVFAAPPILPEP